MAGNANSGRTPYKKPHPDPDALIESTAQAIIAGKGKISPMHNLGPVSDDDRATISRVSRMSIEEFNSHLSEKLRTLADKIATRLEEKIDSDQINPNSLAFNLAVVVDKNQALTGQSQLRQASVNITVNQFDADKTPKQAILDALYGPRASISSNPSADNST